MLTNSPIDFQSMDKSYLLSRRADLTDPVLSSDYALYRRASGQNGRLPEATLLLLIVEQMKRMAAPPEPSKKAEKRRDLLGTV